MQDTYYPYISLLFSIILYSDLCSNLCTATDSSTFSCHWPSIKVAVRTCTCWKGHQILWSRQSPKLVLGAIAMCHLLRWLPIPTLASAFGRGALSKLGALILSQENKETVWNTFKLTSENSSILQIQLFGKLKKVAPGRWTHPGWRCLNYL